MTPGMESESSALMGAALLEKWKNTPGAKAKYKTFTKFVMAEKLAASSPSGLLAKSKQDFEAMAALRKRYGTLDAYQESLKSMIAKRSANA